MAGHLVARPVAARRVVRGPLGVAELHLVGRVRRVHREREADLEQPCAPRASRPRCGTPAAGAPASSRTICRSVLARADAPLERDLGAQRRVAHDRPRLGRRAVARASPGGTGRCPRRRRRRAGRRTARGGCRARRAPRGRSPVDEAHERAVGRELARPVRVLERQPVDGDASSRLRRPRRSRTAAPRRPRTRRPGRSPPRARDTRPCSRAPDSPRPRSSGSQRRPRAAARSRCGVLVDEPDRRAGQDVVELVQQQELPEPVELGARVRRRADGGERNSASCSAARSARLPRLTRACEV